MLDFVDEMTGFGAGAGTVTANSNTLMKSVDGGKTWSQVYSFDSNVTLQAISFLDERSGWALLSSQGSLSIVRTANGGRTWTTAAPRLPIQDTLSDRPLFYFFDLRNGLVADINKQGLLQMHTDDYGATWQIQSRKPLTVSPSGLLTYIFPKEGWYVPRNAAGEPIEIYRMTDGTNLYPVGKIEKSSKDLDQIPAAVSFTSRKRGVLLTESPAAGGAASWHLWETVDSGKTWIDHLFPAGVQISDTNLHMTFSDSNHGWITTSSGILRTEDGGNNWTWLD
jgi:photosystem II stability/assembly factor-like uncharacterized protein